MNALSVPFDTHMTASSPMDSTENLCFALLRLSINKIADGVFNDDLYESAEERRPSGSVVVAAAATLSQLPSLERERAEIEPYSGELSLVWRSGRTKRVKAMFGPEKKSFSVYHEHLVNGRVVEHHLRPQANDVYLRDRLAWLHT